MTPDGSLGQPRLEPEPVTSTPGVTKLTWCLFAQLPFEFWLAAFDREHSSQELLILITTELTLHFFIMMIGLQQWNSCPGSKWSQRQAGSVLLSQSPLWIPSLWPRVLTVQLEQPGPWTLGSPAALWQAGAPWRRPIIPLRQGDMERRGPSLALNQVDLFPLVAVVNYHKCSGLKWNTFFSVTVLGVKDLNWVSPG